MCPECFRAAIEALESVHMHEAADLLRHDFREFEDPDQLGLF